MTMANGVAAVAESEWIAVCDVDSIPSDGGGCVLYEGAQIAIFRVGRPEKWYGVQNRCPHWNEKVLWRAMTGAQGDEPKIACPMHKKTYALTDGRCLSGDPLALETFEVKVEAGTVYLRRPSEDFVQRERQVATPAAPGCEIRS